MFDKNQNTINLFVTLTTGDDQITGGSGNDTFIEYADSATRTPRLVTPSTVALAPTPTT